MARPLGLLANLFGFMIKNVATCLMVLIIVSVTTAQTVTTIQYEFSGTFTPANGDYHFLNSLPHITSGGSSMDFRALNVEPILSGSTNAAAMRGLRMRVVFEGSGALGLLQGSSTSITHNGTGDVTEMIGHAVSTNLTGEGDAVNLTVFRNNTGNLLNPNLGTVTGNFVIFQGANTNAYFADRIVGVEILNQPEAEVATYAFYTNMSGGANGRKHAIYTEGGAPSKVDALKIGHFGQYIDAVYHGCAVLDFGAIAPGNHEDLTFTVTKASIGNSVAPSYSHVIHPGCVYTMFVSALDTVTVRCQNITSVSINPQAGTFKATVFRH